MVPTKSARAGYTLSDELHELSTGLPQGSADAHDAHLISQLSGTK